MHNWTGGRHHLTELVVLEFVAVAGLTRLGRDTCTCLPRSVAALEAADLLALIMSITRIAALGLSWWCLVSTCLAIAVMGPGTSPEVRRRVLALLPRVIRRHVERAVAATLLAGVLIGQSAAVAAPMPPGLSPEGFPASPVHQVESPDVLPAPARQPGPPGPPGVSGVSVPTSTPTEDLGRPAAHDSWTSTPTAAPVATPTTTPVVIARPVAPVAPLPDPVDATTAPPTVAVEAAASLPDDRHAVLPGEHLWSIARDRVAAAGTGDDDETIARYWRELVAANADDLPSGDPDLVFPGQLLILPALADA